MDRREFVKKAALTGTATAAGFVLGREVLADAADAQPVVLEAGDSVSVLCDPTSTTVPPTTASTTTTLPATTLPATTAATTTTTRPATTTTAPSTTTTTQPTTTTTGPPGGDAPAGALPTSIGSINLGSGRTYFLTGDTVVTGAFTARGSGDIRNPTRIETRGFRLLFDARTAVVRLLGTPLPGGRWSEGNGAWRTGHSAVIAPMTAGDFLPKAYTGGAVPAQPQLGRQAEVINLESDLWVVGPGDVIWTPNGVGARAATLPALATVVSVKFDQLGVQGNLGHYPCHFHLCQETSRGSTVVGSLVVNSKFRGFVPHNSHGITFQDCAAYGVQGEAFWWDENTVSNDILFEDCIAMRTIAQSGFVPANGDWGSRWGEGYRLSAFKLNGSQSLTAASQNITMRRCHAVCTMGSVQSAGFQWPEEDHGLWFFEDCVAHNNPIAGIFAWQNDGQPHVIDGFDTWANQWGVWHGAYLNRYRYNDVRTADCAGGGIHLDAMTGQGARTVAPHPLYTGPMVFDRHQHFGSSAPIRLFHVGVSGGTQTIIHAPNYGVGQVVNVNSQFSVAERLTFT